MAEHGDNYQRTTGPNGEEVGTLSKDCGHHCGVITVGHSDKHVGHCQCPECHNTVKAEMPTQFFMDSGGVDPRGIT